MTNYNIIGEQFRTQDILRTVNFSFQPYLPFTQQYSMMLKGTNNPEKANYFQVGPPLPTKEHQDKSPADSSYPFSMRTKLFMGDAGSATGKITAVARNKSRVDEITKTLPSTQNTANRLAKELSTLLNASYQFDSRNFVEENFHPELSRDMEELETRMFGEILEDEFGIGSDVQQGPMRDPSTFVMTRKSRQGFDMLLSENRAYNSFLKNIQGDKYNPSIDALEISRGVQSKRLLKIGEIEGLSEQKVLEKIIKKYNNEIETINAKVRANITPQLDRLSGIQNVPIELLEPQFLTEAARETFRPGTNKASNDYMGRQIFHRFSTNILRPYTFSGQLSDDSFALITISGRIDGRIPQINLVDEKAVTVYKGAGTIKEGLHKFALENTSANSKSVVHAAERAKVAAAARSVGTRITLESAGRFQMANVAIGANNMLDATITEQGGGSIHKMSMEINTKLLKDIKAYYSTGKMKGQFRLWYDSMMAAANNLSKAWAENSQNVFGQRGMPISKEWRAMSSWENVTGYKKKYIGVWNDTSEQAWKGDIGRNFTIAPFLQSRRQFSAGEASRLFSQQ